jgi:hypothetical protein
MEISKIEPNELDDLKNKHEYRQKVIIDLANNFVTEQQVIEAKPRLMQEQRKAEADYVNVFKKLHEKYGTNIEISLADGTITYK